MTEAFTQLKTMILESLVLEQYIMEVMRKQLTGIGYPYSCSLLICCMCIPACVGPDRKTTNTIHSLMRPAQKTEP